MAGPSPNPQRLFHRHFAHALLGCMADPSWVIPWDRLLAIPGQRLAIIDASGEVRFASMRLLRDAGRRRADRVVARGLLALYPEPLIEEFLAQVRASLSDGRPALLIGVIDGRRQGVAVYPLISASGERRALIAMIESGDWSSRSIPPSAFRVADLGYATLGGLDGLTVRELDVLRGLGLGLSRKTLAQRLHSDSRDVGRIVRSLRSKLACPTGFRVAVEALHRGLHEITDDHWDRIAYLRDAR